MPQTKQLLPVKVPVHSSEAEALEFNYDEFEGLVRARVLTAQNKIAGRLKMLAWADKNKPEPINLNLKTEAVAERIGAKIGKCPSHWLQGSDDAGHVFAKELFCGAEWCPVCGKKDSKAHLRRFASWLPKAQQTKSLGLMVVEFPLASRNKPRSRSSLEYYGKLAVKVLTGRFEIDGRRKRGEILRRGEVAEIKARHFSRGMRRWHYFGDVQKELKKLGLSDIYSSEADTSPLVPSVKSNVHLNCLLDAGYITKPWLLHIVKTLRIAFNEPDLIVHYGYVTEPGAMVHLLKYTTRATFLNYKWDKWLAGQLYGFRNMRSWGVWSEPELWSLDYLPVEQKTEYEGVNIEAINSLGKSRCYKDGLPIHWSKPRAIAELRGALNKVDLGGGYYELPLLIPPSARLIEPDKMRWQRFVVEAETRIKREAQLKAYYSTNPDAVMPSFMPDLVDNKHFYNGQHLASASNEVALWGGEAVNRGRYGY